MAQPMATMMPPKATTNFGPRRGPSRSTIHPSIGVSHVSRAMKIANATWIEAMVQPCALLIGLTNSVQPYCKLAIIIMQMMIIIRLTHRTEPEFGGVATVAVPDTLNPPTVIISDVTIPAKVPCHAPAAWNIIYQALKLYGTPSAPIQALFLSI